MGLCKTSNFSIFTFINASDLKFCPRSYSSCIYLMMRFKGLNGKICKMMTSHFRTPNASRRVRYITCYNGGLRVISRATTVDERIQHHLTTRPFRSFAFRKVYVGNFTHDLEKAKGTFFRRNYVQQH